MDEEIQKLIGEPLVFPGGLPAFEHERFMRLTAPDCPGPLLVLESTSPGGPQFLVAPVLLLVPDYKLELSTEDQLMLQPEPEDRLIVLAIVSVEELRLTVNLLAPVVLNARTRRGVQSVRWDTLYSHAYSLEAGVLACS
jgi:flagellar assembly factor FliW